MRLAELQSLKETLRKSECEVERLQALIVRMKTKGKLVNTAVSLPASFPLQYTGGCEVQRHIQYPIGFCCVGAHVEPSILWRRDPGVLQE